MELYQLRSFTAVAEEGNLTRAAARLFSSQPSVSAHIKALEDEMGLSLFDRTARGMALTQDGEALLEKVDSILQQIKELNELARNLQANPSGTLRVGVLLDGDPLPLDTISRILNQSCPGLQLEFVHSSSGAIAKALLNGDIDLGFAEGEFDSPLLRSLKVGATQVVVAAAPCFEEAFQSSDWKGLESLPWVFKTPECSYHELMTRISLAHGLDLNKQYVIDHEATCLQFVQNGIAISVVNRSSIETALKHGHLIAWKGFQGVLDVSLIYLSKRASERAVSAFIESTKIACTTSPNSNASPRP